jgi:hypothetical protein
MKSAKEIVLEFYSALEKQDYAGVRRLLHDNFLFRGPIDTFDQAAPYVEAVKKLAPITERIEVKKMFAEEKDVCVLYDLVMSAPARTAFVSEWFRVKGEKIAAIQVVFDARPFAAMFAK